jgi:hypothetical protein
MSMERVCDVFQIALLFPIYGQYFCVAVGITRVVDAMSLIVFLHAKQSTSITQKTARMMTAALRGKYLCGIHDPKVIYPKKVEAVQPFSLHIVLLPNVGELRPGFFKG